MTKRKLLLTAAVAAVGVGGAAVAVGGRALGPPPGAGPGQPETVAGTVKDAGPVPVTTEAVVARPVQRTVAVVGSLYGRDEVAVSAKVEGTVRRIHRDVGDEVKPGDVLLELDPTDAELAVAEALKGLELELAKLGLKQPPPDTFDVSTLPTVARAAVKDRYTTGRFERVGRNRSTSAVSTDEFQQAEFDARDAQEAHRQARLDAEATLAAVRQRQAALDTAKQRLKDTRILAPVPGTYTPGGPPPYVVAQRTVSEGEMVHPGTAALFRLVVAHTLKLQAAVPERHLGEVKVGQPVVIRVEAYPRETFPGAVGRVNPTVDRTSRTFQVEVTVPNPGRRLAPGSFAKAEVRTRLDPDAVLVPEEALVQFAGVTKVFVVRDGKAAAVAVRPTDVRVDGGDTGRSRVLAEVTGGVRPGDRVVTTGQTKLTDGAAVRVRSDADKGDTK